MRNAYTLVASAAVMSALGLVYWAVAARLYPSDVVGTVSALVALMMMVSTLCQLGMPAVLLRSVPEAGAGTRELVIRAYTAVACLSLVVGELAAATGGIWSDDLAFLAADPLWVMLFGASCAAWSVFSLQDPVLIGLRQSRLVPLENGAHALAKLLLLLPLALVGSTAVLFATWAAPTAVLVAVVTWLLLRRFFRLAPTTPTHLPSLREVVRFGGGQHLASIIGAATAFGAPLLVTAQAGSVQTAHFYVAWMFSVGLSLVASNMAMSLTVESVLDRARMQEFVRSVARGALQLLVPAVVVLVVAAPFVLRLFGDEYAENASTLLRLLAVAALPNVAFVTALGVARALGNVRLAVLGQTAATLITLGLATALLESKGIVAVGIGWLVSQIVVGLASLVWLRRVIVSPPTQAESGS